MRNQLMLLVVICALILITGAYPLQAHWIEDGLGVCNLASHSTGPVSAPAGRTIAMETPTYTHSVSV
jgi:hypothetical protein